MQIDAQIVLPRYGLQSSFSDKAGCQDCSESEPIGIIACLNSHAP